ncbi:MAG TPA: hypothetical protein VFB66_15690 [Tepidisphaeraceae bacterium]|nr:hypothetical protein [Tepidisphaeraceae bacterium]
MNAKTLTRLSPPLMQFNLSPWTYRVRLCPGPLMRDGEPMEAITHEHDILIAGDLIPAERVEALVDQFRWLREKHHGPLCPEGIPSFVVSVLRQLNAQGGEAMLSRPRSAAAPAPAPAPGYDCQRQRRAA